MERQGEIVTLILAERTLPSRSQNFWIRPDSELTAKDLVETLWHIGIRATLAQPEYADEVANGVLTSRTLNDLVPVDTVFTRAFAEKAIFHKESKVHWDRMDTALSLGALLLFGLRAQVPEFSAEVPAELLPVLLWKLSPILALAPLGLRRILKDRHRRNHDNLFQIAAKKAVAESITVKERNQIPQDYTSYFCYVRQENSFDVLRISRNADFRMVLPEEELLADGTMRRVGRKIFFLLDEKEYDKPVRLNQGPGNVEVLLKRSGFPETYEYRPLRFVNQQPLEAWENLAISIAMDIAARLQEEEVGVPGTEQPMTRLVTGFGWRKLPLIGGV